MATRSQTAGPCEWKLHGCALYCKLALALALLPGLAWRAGAPHTHSPSRLLTHPSTEHASCSTFACDFEAVGVWQPCSRQAVGTLVEDLATLE